jgi:hypothetical protein
LRAEGLNAKDIHKEMFPVYGGKCLSRKAVHNWVEKRIKYFPDDEEVETEVRKWLIQQSKDFYHMFYFFYPFATLPRIFPCGTPTIVLDAAFPTTVE